MGAPLPHTISNRRSDPSGDGGEASGDDLLFKIGFSIYSMAKGDGDTSIVSLLGSPPSRNSFSTIGEKHCSL